MKPLFKHILDSLTMPGRASRSRAGLHIVLLVGVGLCAKSSDVLAQDAGDLEALRTLVNALAPEEPTDRLSVDTLAASLGGPEAVFRFVRENIAFEPYGGQLRGPRGTLVSQAGNAIDQALLVAALLDALGTHWRFVRMPMDSTQRAVMLDSLGAVEVMVSDMPEAEASGDLDAEPPDEPDLDLESESSESESSESEPSESESDGRVSTHLLSAVGDSLRDHWWIQAETAAADWTDLDTAYPGLSFGEQIGEPVGTYRTQVVPPQFVQPLVLRIQYRSGRDTVRTALTYSADAWTFANRGVFVVFERTAPGTLLPSFRVGPETLRGEEVTLSEAEQLWLSIEVGFGEDGQQHVRMLRQPDGMRDWFRGDVQVFGLLVLPGWVSDQYFAHVSSALAESMLSSTEALAHVTEGESELEYLGPEIREPLILALSAWCGLVGLSTAAVLDGVAQQVGLQTGVLPYFPRTRLVMVGALQEGSELGVFVDIIESGLDALPLAEPELVYAFSTTMGATTATTASDVLQRLSPHDDQVAPEALFAAMATVLDPVTVNAETTRDLRRSGAPDGVRALAGYDTEPDRVVVITGMASPERGFPLYAWMVVHPSGWVESVLQDGTHGPQSGVITLAPLPMSPFSPQALAEEVMAFAVSAAGGVPELGGAPVAAEACASGCILSTLLDAFCSAEGCAVGGGDRGPLSCSPTGSGLACGVQIRDALSAGAFDVVWTHRYSVGPDLGLGGSPQPPLCLCPRDTDQ